jgi:hypothetical protein
MRQTLIIIAVVLAAVLLLRGIILVLAPIALYLVLMLLLRRAYERRTGRRLDAREEGLLFALAANLFMVVITLVVLLPAPSGAAIRPMGLTATYFLAALTAAPVGISLAMRGLSIQKQRRRLTAGLTIALSLTPILVAIACFYGVVLLKGFELKP